MIDKTLVENGSRWNNQSDRTSVDRKTHAMVHTSTTTVVV